MNRKQKRIYVLTPVILVFYLILKELIWFNNIPYCVLIVVMTFVIFVIILDGWIKKLFLNAYNRFAYFSVFFLIFSSSFLFGMNSAKEKIMNGDETYIYSLAYNTFSLSTSQALLCIFIIAYIVSRLKDYTNQRKYIKQAIEGKKKDEPEDIEREICEEYYKKDSQRSEVFLYQVYQDLRKGVYFLGRYLGSLLKAKRNEESHLKCSKCGIGLERGQKYCSNCGQEIEWEDYDGRKK